ncbi:MAG: T9SS type A sorting domain-containing protein [Bacteroidota bacterium]|nr:T9SS type A sorting domain-containing protein [Bacteroidota bacterium]MDP4232033.1 T9SS type A sorting domain-containing protein [Bacteroidota bacterium]MDP4241260.1 T9SS type A sorting domain-containing protein [Bacteroidota bacterium]MDP4286652.1 T9SS type A sorting domain-containing protein [Bacteroidota bacterium]
MSDNSLNDLFKASRNEAVPEFVSERDAERLLAEHPMRSVPRTIGQKLFQRLLSSPRKLGITAMTVAGIITIGILALQPHQTQNSSNIQSPKAQSFAAIDTTSAKTPTRVVRKTLRFAFADSSALPALPPLPPLPATPPIPPLPAVAIHPVELAPEQLAQLGVVLKDNGDIDFYTKDSLAIDGDTGYVNHYGLPPTWGLRIHLLAHAPRLTANALPELHILPSPPKLITATNGTKRLFSFRSSFALNRGRFHTETLKSFIGPSGTYDVIPVFDDDSIYSTQVANQLLNPNHASRQSEGSMKVVLNPQNGPRDTSGNDFTNSFVKRMNKPNKVFDAPDPVDTEYNAFIDNSDAINRLIPIHIHNANNPDHVNDLIFWYEPTADITNLVKEAASQELSVSENTHVATSRQPHFTLSIFPNPTSGAAKVHYTIDGGKEAEFGVYNLLGQKLIDAGTASGTGDLSLDLSKLEAGVYLLVTSTKDGEQSIERIVLNK